MEKHCLTIEYQQVGTVLNSLFLDKETADIYFLCQADEVKVPAHRCILATVSTYFRAMLYGKMKESSQLMCNLQVDFPSTIVIKMLEFIYLGQVSITIAQVPEVIIAADYFNLGALLVALEATIKIQMNPIRCCSLLHHLYVQASTCEVPPVLSKMQDLCCQYLQSNLQKLMLTDEALTTLPPKFLCHLVCNSQSIVGMSTSDLNMYETAWTKLQECIPHETYAKLFASIQDILQLRPVVNCLQSDKKDCPQQEVLPFPVKLMSSNAVIAYSAKQLTVECKQMSNPISPVPLVGMVIRNCHEREFSCTAQLMKIDKDCQHEGRAFHLTLVPMNSTEDIVQTKVPITGFSRCAKVTTRNMSGTCILNMATHTVALPMDNTYILGIGLSCFCISFTLHS